MCLKMSPPSGSRLLQFQVCQGTRHALDGDSEDGGTSTEAGDGNKQTRGWPSGTPAAGPV